MRTWNVRAVLCASLVFALLCFSPFLPFSPRAGQFLVGAAALPAYGGCLPPSHAGVSVCAPSPLILDSVDTPFQVTAAASSGVGEVVTMEVWADGHKVTQANGTPFNAPITLDTGTHTLTVKALDSTGATIDSAPISLTVNTNDQIHCSPPSSPGVHVCQPQAGGCQTSTYVTVVAAGKGESGTVSRMELWAAGTDLANFPGDQINTNLFIEGYDYVTIYEVDSHGNTIK
ncbi:MAG: Ig-like domain-containing protein, partial [Terracidiphilus sp.]